MNQNHSGTTNRHYIIVALIFGYGEFTNKQDQYKHPALVEKVFKRILIFKIGGLTFARRGNG